MKMFETQIFTDKRFVTLHRYLLSAKVSVLIEQDTFTMV